MGISIFSQNWEGKTFHAVLNVKLLVQISNNNISINQHSSNFNLQLHEI